MAKVTLFGLAGTGKSTVAKSCVALTGYRLISGGDLARLRAAELGISIYDYNKRAQEDQSFDRDIDTYLEHLGKEEDNFICESWMGWRFVPDSLKVRLDCDEDVRIDRIAARENLSREEALRMTRLREATKVERFTRYYNLPSFPPPDQMFELIIDTTATHPDVIARRIAEEIGKLS